MAGQPFLERPQEASIVERIHNILTKCARGSTAAAASSDSSRQQQQQQYTWTRTLSHDLFKNGIGVLENIPSATDLASRSFGLLVGDDGLVDRSPGSDVVTLEPPFHQQHKVRHPSNPLLGGFGLVWLIIGRIFSNRYHPSFRNPGDR